MTIYFRQEIANSLYQDNDINTKVSFHSQKVFYKTVYVS